MSDSLQVHLKFLHLTYISRSKLRMRLLERAWRANICFASGAPFRARHERPCPPEAHSLLMVSSLISHVRTARLRAVRARRRHYILLLTL